MSNTTKQTSQDELPFVAPCNDIPVFAALDWIVLGWKDFKQAPALSISFGIFFVVTSYLLAMLSWQWGGVVLLFSLLSGFVFMAPVLALGLYSVSSQLRAGFKPKFIYCLREGKRHLANEAIFSFVLLIIFLVWVRAGSAIHIFFPMKSDTEFSDFITFLAVGSVVGSVFALLVFSASAFALPMIMDRKADAITAILSSVNATRKNKLSLLVWASTIVCCLFISMLTAFFGMLIIMPVLGYATWHGYKQTINSELWLANRNYNERHPGE